MAPKSRPPSPSLRIGVLLLIGIGGAVGLAAAFLRSPAPAGSGPAASPSTTLILSPLLLGSLIVGVCLVGLAFLLIYQFRNGRSPFPSQVVVGFLLVLLLLVGFVGLSHFFTTPQPGGGNSTAPSPSNQSSPASSNSTSYVVTGPGGSIHTLGLTIPWWLVAALAAAAAIAVAYVAMPFVTSRRDRGRGSELPSERATQWELHRLFQKSLADFGEVGSDPRPAIVELYGRLLKILSPRVGGVDFDTPSEIRERHLVRLGVELSTAATLTRLFEIARYSTAPLGPKDREAARQAIFEAMTQLDLSTDPGEGE
jgi:hypothetical protein